MKKICLLLMIFMARVVLFAQSDPVSWTTSLKKVKGNSYEIHLFATVKAPWHIYSQYTPAGGPVPTVLNFTKNPLVILEGNVEEKGNLVKKHEEVFKTDVLFFNNTVDFVQVIKVKASIKTNLTATIKYMVCNDKECLAPKTLNFPIDIK